MKSVSLRTKLGLTAIGAAALTVGASAYFMVLLPQALQRLVHHAGEALGHTAAQEMAQAIGMAMATAAGDAAASNVAFDAMAKAGAVQYAALLAPDGRVMRRYNPAGVSDDVMGQPSRAGLGVDKMSVRVVRDIEVDGGIVGSLILGLDLTALRAEVANIRTGAQLVALSWAAPSIMLALAVFFMLVRPIAQLANITARIVQTGDLTRTVELLRTDGLGLLANSVGAMVHQQRMILARINKLTAGVTTVAERVFVAGHAVSTGATDIQARVVDTASAAQEVLDAIGHMGHEVEDLTQTGQRTSTSLMQMAASRTHVMRSMQSIGESTAQTADSVGNMSRSFGDVSRNVARLDDTIQQTTDQINTIAKSIEEVEATSRQTAALSARVFADAEVGVQALQKTLHGIDNIKEASQSAADVMANLGRRIDEIGSFLRIIDEVAAQTKLLSLNAAIIASQAGEHGRGFDVVADQIKQLAQRTGASTREIAQLIDSVQKESHKALQAMARGVTSVEAGVLLGARAESALGMIRSSAGAATRMIEKIAAAVVDQTRSSKQLTDSIAHIGHAVGLISQTSEVQTRGTEQINASSNLMQAMTEQVRVSAQEQIQYADEVVHAVQNINGMVGRLGMAQRTQIYSASRVRVSVEEIRRISHDQSSSMGELVAAIGALTDEAQALAAEVQKYKI